MPSQARGERLSDKKHVGARGSRGERDPFTRTLVPQRLESGAHGALDLAWLVELSVAGETNDMKLGQLGRGVHRAAATDARGRRAVNCARRNPPAV
jgi:hypothetical protein